MTTQAGPTHYDTLGVAPDATAADIKRAYRTLIRQVHPDVAGPEGAVRAAEISAAYEVLSRPELREEYDVSLAAGGDSEDAFADTFEDSWGSVDDWDRPADAGSPGRPRNGADSEEEVLDDVVVDDGSPMHVDPPPVAAPAPNSPIQPLPPAPVAHGVVPAFVPPLRRPEVARRRTPRWIVAWMIGFSIPAVLTIGFVLLGLVLESSTGQQSSGPGLLIALIIFWVAVVSGPLALRRLTAPKPPKQLQQLATDLLPEVVLQQQVHGGPEQRGPEEWRRTDDLLRTSVLPSFPAMRLIHGLRRPGIDPGVVDQVVIIGHTMIVIDSAFWQDGHYWWDGSRLFRNGRAIQPFRLGSAVELLRHGFPGVNVIGAVVLYGPEGRLDRPLIENAPPSNGMPLGQQFVPVLNPAGLIDFVRRIADGVPDRQVVDVNLLTHLLQNRA